VREAVQGVREKERRELLGVPHALSGTRFEPRRLRRLLRVDALMEWELASATYNEVEAKGEARGLARGREEGLEQGREQGPRDACMGLAEAKIGRLSAAERAELEARLEEVHDLAVLKELLLALGSVRSPTRLRGRRFPAA
jgi:predicted transposase YdaD